MPDKLVPTERTPVSMVDYFRGLLRQWGTVGGVPRDELPSKGACSVLWAQYMIETGGRDSYGWNIGNSKEVANDGINYHALRGVWEGVSPAAAAKLIASGQATADPSAEHAKAVGPGRVSVLFGSTHPASWFSSFPSLDEGMHYHLSLLLRRFSKAWPAVLAGDYRGFARLLKTQGYFTASADAYAAGMRGHFELAMARDTYDGLVVEVLAARLARRADREEITGSGGTVHKSPYDEPEPDTGEDDKT